MQAKDASQLTADYVSSSEPDWGDNPATFEITINIASPLHGEYQLANGLGPEKAATVFKVNNPYSLFLHTFHQACINLKRGYMLEMSHLLAKLKANSIIIGIWR